MENLQPPLTAHQLASGVIDLISLPEVYLQLQRMMDSKESTSDKIADIVSLDPALVAKMLKISNSALYSFPSPVETVSRAVNILGTHQIHDLVLAAGMNGAFHDMPNELMDMSVFWQRSVQTGILARTLAEGAGMRGGESLFVRGLLHNIGHLVLYRHFPDLCRMALKSSKGGLKGLYMAEQKYIGCSAIDVTIEVSKIWGLPKNFIDSFTYLDNPLAAKENGREIAMLHIAAMITHAMDTDLLLTEVAAAVHPDIWRLAELPPEVIGSALDVTSLELMDAMYSLLMED